VDEYSSNLDNTYTVDVKKADTLDFLQGEKICLIKIDVEGHEINALKGAEEIIRKNNPIILFEQGKDEISNGRSPVIDFLASMGYEFYTMERSFEFGRGLIFKMLRFFLVIMFKEKLLFRKTSRFTSRFHDMIIAVPRRVILNEN
jgi:hypothetical protein